MTLRRCLVLACLLAAGAAAQAQEAGLPVEDMFRCLWARKALFAQAAYRLYEVEVVGPWPKGSNSMKVKLKLLDDLRDDDASFKPEEAEINVFVSGNRLLADRRNAKRYLAMLRAYTSGKTKRWSLANFGPMVVTAAGKSTTVQYYLVAIDAYGENFWKAFRELVVKPPAGGQAAQFDKMVACLTGDDPEARTLAGCFAGVNGWGYRDGAKTASQPDAFARALLAVKDPKTRALAAQAYGAANADLLPRDPALLQSIFSHADKEVYTPALHNGLRRSVKRAESLTGLIRPALLGPACHVERRTLILSALTAWGEQAGLFAAELEAIARGRAAPPATDLDRVTALRLCLDADCDGADRLVLDTLVTVPSAVALKYAVDNKLYAVVPAVIGAARAGKLQWTETHGAALALLTRRHVDGKFESFDAWWAAVEKAGQGDAAVRDGFPDPDVVARCRELIAQLASPRYRVREAAKVKLCKLGGAALGELEKASRSANPEVAASAAEALAASKDLFKGSADRLAAAANAERAGKTFLPMPQ
ncbi:MAG TPA: hypothetical protein VFJ30_12265 [Phycisphaerae bacterium]|nr:hypothetical protein [Phycisphaerae bacterium]